MATTALDAATLAISGALLGDGEPWEDKVGGLIIPSWYGMPWLQVSYISGEDAMMTTKDDGEFLFLVKAVTESIGEGHSLAARLSALLKDKGENDTATGFLYGGADWRVLSVTQENVIHYVDMWSKIIPIYHTGFYFRLILEAR